MSGRIHCTLSDVPVEITCEENPVVFLWMEGFTVLLMVGMAAVRTDSQEKKNLVWHKGIVFFEDDETFINIVAEWKSKDVIVNVFGNKLLSFQKVHKICVL